MELAAKDIKDTQGGVTPLPTPVNKIQQGQGGAAKGTKNSLSCYHCGGKRMASRCRFKTEMSRVKLDGKELCMEVDASASVSLSSEATYKKLWEFNALPELQQTTVKLCTYVGEEIGVLGCIDVKVQTHGRKLSYRYWW